MYIRVIPVFTKVYVFGNCYTKTSILQAGPPKSCYNRINMTESATGIDRFRAILVLAATIGTIFFNWLAAMGRIGGVTPAEISDKYPTLITPAGYAVAIWSLIYVGLIAFSIYQLLPANIARYRNIRSLYIATCALNCGWIYFWHGDQIVVCMVLILGLLATLSVINAKFRETDGSGEYWLVKAPFSVYFGWVTAATLVNFAILLVYLGVELSTSAATGVAVGIILLAGTLGVVVRKFLNNDLYPLAIAWALTAIGIKQSGQTLIVFAAAIGVVACLIATLSFVVNLPTSGHPANQ
ncbi:tryptophan-rich sensory protein [soil metagenome]